MTLKTRNTQQPEVSSVLNNVDALCVFWNKTGNKIFFVLLVQLQNH